MENNKDELIKKQEEYIEFLSEELGTKNIF